MLGKTCIRNCAANTCTSAARRLCLRSRGAATAPSRSTRQKAGRRLPACSCRPSGWPRSSQTVSGCTSDSVAHGVLLMTFDGRYNEWCVIAGGACLLAGGLTGLWRSWLARWSWRIGCPLGTPGVILPIWYRIWWCRGRPVPKAYAMLREVGIGSGPRVLSPGTRWPSSTGWWPR